MELEQFRQFIGQVDGFCREEDCFFLYSLVKDLRQEADILELGSFKGRVTIAFALAVKETNQKSRIYAIDSNLFGTKNEFLNNLGRFKVKKSVTPIFYHSGRSSKNWKEKLKLIWIDTDGSYFSAKCDFILWEPYLIKDGVIAFACAESASIKRVVKDCIIGSKRFERIRQAGPVIIAYKAKEALPSSPWKKSYIRLIYGLSYMMKKVSYYLRDKFCFSWLRGSRFKRAISLFLEKLLKF